MSYKSFEPRTYEYRVLGVVPWLEVHDDDVSAGESLSDFLTTVRPGTQACVMYDDEVISYQVA